jgi:hypothetical protein
MIEYVTRTFERLKSKIIVQLFDSERRRRRTEILGQSNDRQRMTTNLSEQISSAVSIALNSDPTTLQSTRHEAHLFLTQVKEAHQQTWQACLSLFLEEEPVGSGSKRWSNEARLFGIQVVGER